MQERYIHRVTRNSCNRYVRLMLLFGGNLKLSTRLATPGRKISSNVASKNHNYMNAVMYHLYFSISLLQ